MKKNKIINYLLLGLTGILVSCEANELNSELSGNINSDISNSVSGDVSSNINSDSNTSNSFYSKKDQNILNSYFNFNIPYVSSANSYDLYDYSDDYNDGYAMVTIYFNEPGSNAYTTLSNSMKNYFKYVFSYDGYYGDTYECFLDSSNTFALEITYVEESTYYDEYIELTIYDLTSELGYLITNNKLSSSDQATIKSYLGVDLPVVGTSYSLTDYTDSYSEYYEDSTYLLLYLNNITNDEYNSLCDNFDSIFTFEGTETDDSGFVWDCFSYNSLYINITIDNDYYYQYACVKIVSKEIYEDNDGDDSGWDDDTGDDDFKSFVDGNFDTTDLALLNNYFNFSIPTIGDYYYITDETEDNIIDVYIDYCYVTLNDFNTFVNTSKTSFNYIESDVYYGITSYYYSKDDFYISISYYSSYECIEMNIYDKSLADDTDDTDDNNGSGNNNNNNDSILTNDNKGLPAGVNGIYNIDFKAEKVLVKNVNDLYDYKYGCPTTGSPKVLVVPVQFSDCLAADKNYTIDNIQNAFLPNLSTDADLPYYSVYDYFYESSYHQLSLDIEVLDEWFTPEHNSSYYLNYEYEYTYGNQTCTLEIGDQVIMDEVLQYLDEDKNVDLSKYDTNNDSCIDAIVLINTLEIDSDVTMKWAYRYWNYYTDENDEYYEYDGVSANDYLWASYQFLFEDDNGFTGSNPTNTYTYIHEFSHILGADDYYDTSEMENHPLNGYDIMDQKTADHSPFTKFNYGWISESKLIVADDEVEVTLDAFEESGDTVIIANNFSVELGMYQEYWIVCYYNNTGLNSGEYGLFAKAGIVVYHINASLGIYENEYYIYNTNTDPNDKDYGTEDNLIELVKNGSSYVYGLNDSLSANTCDDSNNIIAYTFKVTALDEKTATLTFTKNSNSFTEDNSSFLGWI